MRILNTAILTLAYAGAFAHSGTLYFTPVAAQQLVLPRLDGKTDIEMLIIIKSTKNLSQFAIIRHTISTKNYKKWFSDFHKFRQIEIVNKHSTTTLKKTFEATRDDGPSDFIEFWDMLPDVEQDSIPFGQTVPVYFTKYWSH